MSHMQNFVNIDEELSKEENNIWTVKTKDFYLLQSILYIFIDLRWKISYWSTNLAISYLF